jgi:hypothetical protein
MILLVYLPTLHEFEVFFVFIYFLVGFVLLPVFSTLFLIQGQPVMHRSPPGNGPFGSPSSYMPSFFLLDDTVRLSRAGWFRLVG